MALVFRLGVEPRLVALTALSADAAEDRSCEQRTNHRTDHCADGAGVVKAT